MNEYLLNSMLVAIALLIGVIAGIVAGVLSRSSGATHAVSFCYGAGVFAATAVFVLVVKDHIMGA